MCIRRKLAAKVSKSFNEERFFSKKVHVAQIIFNHTDYQCTMKLIPDYLKGLCSLVPLSFLRIRN
jgi:hypothetical protein